jgi:hypothetical protein
MSRWDGPAHKGAMKKAREDKRAEADERNDRTLPENRRQYRLNSATRLVTDVFRGDS